MCFHYVFVPFSLRILSSRPISSRHAMPVLSPLCFSSCLFVVCRLSFVVCRLSSVCRRRPCSSLSLSSALLTISGALLSVVYRLSPSSVLCPLSSVVCCPTSLSLSLSLPYQYNLKHPTSRPHHAIRRPALPAHLVPFFISVPEQCNANLITPQIVLTVAWILPSLPANDFRFSMFASSGGRAQAQAQRGVA